MMPKLTRRQFLLQTVAVPAALAWPGRGDAALELTPRQTAGPFYPIDLPLDDDNDLTRVAGQLRPARGQITELNGRLRDPNGRPLPGLRIEIWQCDAHGRYRHPRDSGRRTIDSGFQGHGHTNSDRDGRYRFRTIRPVPYPGRTPHIHVAVLPEGEAPFVSQLYVAGDERNAGDFLYNRIAAEQRHLVTAEFVPAQDAEIEFTATWDIVLGVTPA